ncbi:acyl-CoA synthetase FdrA [Elusimicrobiota bacterium]
MGYIKNFIIKNCYRDSVFLMQISNNIHNVPEVNSAALMIGSNANKNILRKSGILTKEGDEAGPGDIIIAVDISSAESFNGIKNTIHKMLDSDPVPSQKNTVQTASFETALHIMAEANLALISVPGQYAAREAKKALKNNLNVMLFSDNVSLDDEISLKKTALGKNLLFMGPDCGSSIINGTPLGFTNSVSKGNIGIAAAAGTGLQEVTVSISKLGGGISHAIGTGSRDLSLEVGGISTAHAVALLNNDINTDVITIISKPPHPEIADKIIKIAETCSKPVVICFIGSKLDRKKSNTVFFTDTLEDTALLSYKISLDISAEIKEQPMSDDYKLINETRAKLQRPQKHIRGLFTGGTLCTECAFILSNHGIKTYSNTQTSSSTLSQSPFDMPGHALIDFGADEFTVGKPHPMIDPSIRNKAILHEASKDEVALLIFDVILGFGSHADPAGSIVKALAGLENKKILIANVCGTDHDPQIYSKQVDILRDKGIITFPTNTQASRFAAKVINKNEPE